MALSGNIELPQFHFGTAVSLVLRFVYVWIKVILARYNRFAQF